MGRVFLHGDVHGDFKPILDFIKKYELDSSDFIIVLGDMGLFWRKDKADADAFIDFYEDYYSANLMFIDGNHENFDYIDKIQKPKGYDNNGIYWGNISPHITYLPRGYVFELYGKRFLCMGGADSIDRFRRIKHLSWWEQERITEEDIAKVDKSIHYDYVLTHAVPESVFNANQWQLCTLSIEQGSIDHVSEKRLDELMNGLDFSNWRFGHYHADVVIDNKFRCLFNDFEEII